jgi:hypothetical protein
MATRDACAGRHGGRSRTRSFAAASRLAESRISSSVGSSNANRARARSMISVVLIARLQDVADCHIGTYA